MKNARILAAFLFFSTQISATSSTATPCFDMDGVIHTLETTTISQDLCTAVYKAAISSSTYTRLNAFIALGLLVEKEKKSHTCDPHLYATCCTGVADSDSDVRTCALGVLEELVAYTLLKKETYLHVLELAYSNITDNSGFVRAGALRLLEAFAGQKLLDNAGYKKLFETACIATIDPDGWVRAYGLDLCEILIKNELISDTAMHEQASSIACKAYSEEKTNPGARYFAIALIKTLALKKLITSNDHIIAMATHDRDPSIRDLAGSTGPRT